MARQMAESSVQPPRLSRRLNAACTTYLEDHAQVSQCLLADQDRSGAVLASLSFDQVLLRQVLFQKARLTNLAFVDCRLERCDFSGTDLSNVRIRRSVFSGCRWMGAQFLQPGLDDVLVVECAGERASLVAARMKAVRFEKCNFREAVFEGCDMSGVVFDHCDLSGADLHGSLLAGADFRTSCLDGLRASPHDLQGMIIVPSQAVQVAGLFGVVVKEEDEADPLL